MDTTKKDRIFHYLNDHPSVDLKTLYKAFKDINDGVVRKVRREWIAMLAGASKITAASSAVPPASLPSSEVAIATSSIANIDDLLRTSVTQLAQNPSPQWVNTITAILEKRQRIENNGKTTPRFMNFDPAIIPKGANPPQIFRLLDHLDWKQTQMYCDMIGGRNVCAVGIRGTGKTAVAEQAIPQLLLKTPNFQVHVFCGKIPTASAFVVDVRNYFFSQGWTEQDFTKCTEYELILPNGSFIMAHANTEADIRRYRGNLNIIDECQLMPSPAFATLLGLMSGTTSFAIWIMGNFGESAGTAFEQLCRNEKRAEIMHAINMKYYELDEDDIHWVSNETKSALRMLMEAIGGEKAIQSQLTPVWSAVEGSYYKTEWVDSAFKPFAYPVMMKSIVAGIDWGDVTGTTIVVVGLGDDGHLYILHIWHKDHPTPTDIELEMGICVDDYGCEFAWELSPSGDIFRNGMKANHQNWVFHDSCFSVFKDEFIYMMYKALSLNKLHTVDSVKSYTKVDSDFLRTLRVELNRYCGDKKMDHFHDACVHAIHHIVQTFNLVEFIHKSAVMSAGAQV